MATATDTSDWEPITNTPPASDWEPIPQAPQPRFQIQPPPYTPPDATTAPIPAGLSKAQLQQMQENARVDAVPAQLADKALSVAAPIAQNFSADLLNTPNNLVGLVAPNSPAAQPAFKPNTPVVNVPSPTGTGVMAGLGKLGAGVLNSFTTPESIVSLPAAAQSSIVRALFAGQMVKNLPQETQDAITTLNDPNATTADKIVAVGNPLVQSAMVGALTFLHGKPTASGIKAADVPTDAPVEKTDAPVANAPAADAASPVAEATAAPPVADAAAPDAPAPAEPTPEEAAAIKQNFRVKPALEINGKTYTGGDTHKEILDTLPQDVKDEYTAAPSVDAQHIFVDKDGNKLSRTDLHKVLGVSYSEDIPKANLIPRPLNPDEISAQTGANYDGEFKNSAGESVKGFTFRNPTHPLKGVTFNLKGDVTQEMVDQKLNQLNENQTAKLDDKTPLTDEQIAKQLDAPLDAPDVKESPLITADGKVSRRFTSHDPNHPLFGDTLTFNGDVTAKDVADKLKQKIEARSQDNTAVIKANPDTGGFDIVRNNDGVLESFKTKAEAEKYLPDYNKPSEVDAIAKKQSPAPDAVEATKNAPEPATGEPRAPVQSPNTTGLAARVRGPREAAGMTAETQPGKGIAPEASVERGKQLLQSGADPEAAMQQFEKTNRASSDDFALARAHQDALARTTNAAEDNFGRDSQQFKDAYKAESDWSARTKAMQTEWAKSGHAQQGEVDVDTGTFSGLKRAYRDSHDGKELPKKDEAKAQALADANKKLADENAALMKKLSDKIDTETTPKVEPHVKLVADRLKGFFETGAKSALDRIKARRAEGRLFTGIDPAELGDYAIYGASKILSKGIEGAEMSAEWAKEMTQEIGDYIKPHLKQIWDASKKSLDASLKKAAGKGDTAKKVIKAAKIKAVDKIPTVESVHEALSDYKGGKMTPEQVRALWQYSKKNYIDKGSDNFGEIVKKVSTDLGLKHSDVANGLAQPKGLKAITNELWRKQADARRVSEAAKQWAREKDTPAISQAIPRLARLMFGAKVFGHGGVAFGTHAPMVAFMPKYTATYLRDFGKMYKMVFSPAEYEKNVQALRSEKNYTTAQRAGLVNDPYKVEDFNNPAMTGMYGKISGGGNRGYFALKILRQDMFDQGWNKLPETVKTPEMAKAMADDINHITGVVKAGAGNKTSLFLFAPKLLMSRAAFALGDPYKAVEIASTAMSPTKWKALPPEQRFHVINQVKQKATILGTAFGLLLANQAMLTAMGSKQKVNMTDPTKSDFMKFKAAGMDFSYGNAMLNMMRLPLRMWSIGKGDGGKLKKIIYPDESMYSAAGEFARSQASPMTGLGLDLLFKGDYQNRPLPQIPGYGKPIPLPKRLAAQGIKPYTWPEFFAEQVSPIPLEEAEREVWRTGFGFSDVQMKQLAKAAGTTIVMMGTGGRLSEDVPYKK